MPWDHNLQIDLAPRSICYLLLIAVVLLVVILPTQLPLVAALYRFAAPSS